MPDDQSLSLEGPKADPLTQPSPGPQRSGAERPTVVITPLPLAPGDLLSNSTTMPYSSASSGCSASSWESSNELGM